MIELFRRVLAALAAVAGMLVVHPAEAAPGPGADLTVGLTATGAFLFTGADYTVSVTNNGPQPLTAATVVVRLDPRASGVLDRPPACPFDAATATLTCAFGPLAVGATARLTTWVNFTLPPAPARVDATAALVSSTPADPDPTDDSATATCHHRQENTGFPPYSWRLYC